MSLPATIRVWTLATGDVTADGGRPPPSWLALMSDDERQRCGRLRRPDDRLSYAAAHALTRRVLADALDVAPERLAFAADDNGKPHLAAPAGSGTDFSLSHTAGMAAVAVGTLGAVGVDVEGDARGGTVDADFARHALPAAEAARILALPEAARHDAFLAAWTACEAVAKADGRGLSLPFSAIAFVADGTATGVATTTGVDEPPRRWRLWRHRPAPAHRLAVAWRDRDAVLHYLPVTVHRGNGYRLPTDGGARAGAAA